MSARDAILAAVRRAAVPQVALPEVPDAWPAVRAGTASGADLARRFSEVLEQVGGTAVELNGMGALAAAVADLPAARVARESGRGIVSSVPRLAISTLVIGPDAPRARLDQVELAIIPGRMGVAENGAIWVSEEDLPHRALPFVAQHLAIVLPRGEIVADLHAAYRRLRPPLPGYGVFISGPSKTADIEQALVIGAQGPKSLTVFLV